MPESGGPRSGANGVRSGANAPTWPPRTGGPVVKAGARAAALQQEAPGWRAPVLGRALGVLRGGGAVWGECCGVAKGVEPAGRGQGAQRAPWRCKFLCLFRPGPQAARDGHPARVELSLVD